MVCPRCKSKKFTASEDIQKPVTLYKTDKFAHANYRYYVCNTCDYRYVTSEIFFRKVNVNQPERPA